MDALNKAGGALLIKKKNYKHFLLISACSSHIPSQIYSNEYQQVLSSSHEILLMNYKQKNKNERLSMEGASWLQCVDI
jgi:hypothetical protein